MTQKWDFNGIFFWNFHGIVVGFNGIVVVCLWDCCGMPMGLLWGFCGVVLRFYGTAVGLHNAGPKKYLWILCVGIFLCDLCYAL